MSHWFNKTAYRVHEKLVRRPTFSYLQELEEKRLQEIKQKQKKLQELFEAGKIRADHFDCAFGMLDQGHSNGYLDGLLTGDISPKTFTRLFTCEE